jgi:hypothetical protein
LVARLERLGANAFDAAARACEAIVLVRRRTGVKALWCRAPRGKQDLIVVPSSALDD